MPKLIAYTDGSCLGNPGPGGWAFLIIDKRPHSEKIIFRQSGHELNTTNNRMEMRAFLEACKYFSKIQNTEMVEINSDSNLLVQTINQGWKRKANQDLWMEIEKYLPKIQFQLSWVKAHADNQFNNECDRLAFAAAQKAQKILAKSPHLVAPLKTEKTKKPDLDNQASLF